MDPLSAFLDDAVWHGDLEDAEAILRSHPEISGAGIHVAALLGDDQAVRRFLALEPSSANAKSGPRGWDPLTFLCFSKYLRLDAARTPGFLRAAEALLDAGASPNTGFWEPEHRPHPEWESALYGAAGVAHHAELTRLLLARGADPNDGETPYHAPEGYDNAAMGVLVESGRLTADSLTTMLLRKADWHDREGIRYLLEHGTDPNRMTVWRRSALHQAVRRDNGIEIVEAMLDHGADPSLPDGDGRSAASLAARRGRGDILDAFERRSLPVEFHGLDRLIAACARGRAGDSESNAGLPAEGGTLLAEFAGNGNCGGVTCLLDAGIEVTALHPGDLYWDVAPNSTALHVAAWRARHETVKLLLDRGAPVDALDGKGRTPLALAVRASVDSYWAARRSTVSIEALLRAGASPAAVNYPSGYAEADELLRTYGR